VAAATVLPTPTPAVAGPAPTCGATLTTNAALTADLSCTGSDLTLAPPTGSTLTLNLAGHTISGAGILVQGSVSVVNGSITNVVADCGIRAPSATTTQVKINHVVFSSNQTGVCAEESDNLQILNSTFSHNARGIFADECSFYLIKNNTFIGNTTAGADISVSDGTFQSNVVADNAVGVSYDSFTPRASVFKHNVFTHNTTSGLTVQMAPPASLEVVSNQFTANGGVGLLSPASSLATNGLVSKNLFASNGLDGAQLQLAAGSTLTVSKNLAYVNGGYGIEASNATDGGKNTADSNGNPAECLGVACSQGR
jgi:parallel beta-helix repeat protein